MVFNREMAVRGGAVDMPAFIFLAVLGNDSRKISAATQDFRQHGFAADMHHNKNRSIEILRQIFGEVTKRLYAARRRSDDDDVAFVHLVKPPSKVNRSYTVKRVDRLFRNGLPCASGPAGIWQQSASGRRGASASPKTMGRIGEGAGVGARSRGQLTARGRADSIANALATRRPTAIAACVMLRRN